MANRHVENTPADWHIDRNCINCSAARTVAPGLIVSGGGQSVFARQPETPDELMMAWRARLLCPTASVRTKNPVTPPAGVFPEEMTQGVYRLGYNAKSSYGSHSFLILRSDGNAMVDSPRWTKQVVSALEEAGGLSDVLLTHEDDVADADRYAEHFGARVSIHQADRDAARYATQIFEGRDPIQVYHDLLAIPVPGHTRGSVVYLWQDRCLFTGDSLSWSFADSNLEAFRDFCWYSWDEQRRSLAGLLNYNFEWVLAGHGGSHGAPAEEMRSRLQALVERMN
jgi:glyoxylase-like metal-dependent hydrolase (beta-lactamase superfamily II)